MKQKQGYHITGKEHASMYLFAFGGSAFAALTGVFNVYLSDIGVTAGVIAILLLITRVWDFINDPLAGIIIEKAHFKSGKYIPWLKASSILMPIFGAAMFFIPSSMPMVVKIIVPVVLFVLYEGCFTFFDIPIFGIRLVMTDSVQERTDLQAILAIFSFVGTLIMALLFPQIRPILGWRLTAIILSAFAALTFIFFPRTAKERFNSKNEEEPTIKAMIHYVIKNKPLLIFYGATFICMCSNFIQVIMMYLARYVYGNEGMMTIIALVLMLPFFLSAVLLPVITKKTDKFVILMLSNVGFAILGVVHYFVGYTDITASFIVLAVRGLFVGIQSLLLYAFTADMVEWHHYIKGERNEAMAFSFQTLTAKLINALLSVIMMAMLGFLGFKSGENALQPPEVVTGIWAMFTWIPSVSTAVAMVFYSFYHPRDKKVQVMIRANHGEITKAQAENELAALGGYTY
ncbi:MFS transporter [Spirochaetia bacterium]|nr:MFS transporter [Spirochaetia bacterium]